ncbi:MAG TPA: glycoside hydrolase family 36 protein [Vicinamibacterales bacterium]|nr:glycoside hydrolase family 36 protein [Vicinamibacterales bacterium]
MRHAFSTAAIVACGTTAFAADRGPIVASVADAFVAHAPGSDTWSIGSAQVELVVGFDSTRTLTLQRLFNPATGRAWEIGPAAAGGFTAGTERIALTSSGAATLVSATTRTTQFGVELTFLFEHRGQRLHIARVYACYSASPTIETWARITSTGGDGTAISDFAALQMAMQPGHLQWLGGLRGDAAGGSVEDAFVVADRDVEADDHVELGASGRSSETFVPLLWVQHDGDEFYSGLMWSGAWRADLSRAGERLQLRFDFPGVTTTVAPSRPLELPHSFFGLTRPAETDASGALHQFVRQGVRRGRPFTPLVTYNTWFVYGTTVNEEAMVAEMDRAAALGAELFVLDAGWYVGAGETSEFDFDSGLGSWTVDPDRFPSGLASLADYAHGLGMKFGLWVEPERVALSTVERPGLAREAWLATRDGSYGAQQTAQLCLAGAQARQWVLTRLTALIDEIHPDYLKWDNNFWLNCNRQGHGHGAADGNLAHVQALYGLLDDLRRRYPDLLIENVSGGGARIDFGMLAYTDTAWMDDRTAPAAHVRHNLEGLTIAFPPPYLLSFLIDGDGEPIAGAQDLALLTRSRGAGVLGLTYRADLLDDDTATLLTLQIAEYKAYRDIVAEANASLLTLQAPYDVSGWDALQEISGDDTTALIFAFEGEMCDDRLLVHPRGLISSAVYDVLSLDGGALGSARGEELMRDGIEVVHSSASRAHVLLLRARAE